MAGRTIPERFRRDMTVPEVHEYLSSPSRRRFLQGALATAGALAVGPTLWTKAARAAGAPPAGAHLAFGSDPQREMSVVWSTPGPVDRPRLSFGTADGTGTVVAAETRTVPANLLDPLSPVPTHYHHVRLEGLDPGTAHGYRLLHDGGDSGPRAFETAPTEPVPFTFTAFGDHGVSSAARATLAGVAAARPAFHLVAGDICYADPLGRALPTDITDFDPLVWDAWFAQTAPSAGVTPWMPAMGNHDIEPGFGWTGYDGHASRLALPTGGLNQVVYSFRYGNVAVVSLDANDVSSEILHSYSGGAQTAWLDRELGRLRADPAVDFIVAFFHHCAYSTITSHGSDGGVRREWVPVFDRHGVDLVINGHNHGYERTTPIRGNVPTVEARTGATVRPADHGTTYVCAGGGGRSPNELGPPGQGFVSNGPYAHDAPGITGEPEAAPWSVVAAANNSFLRVDVAPPDANGRTTMSVSAVDTAGRTFDSVVLSRQRTVAAAPTTTVPASGALGSSGGRQIPATGREERLLVPALALAGAVAAGGAARAASRDR
jgi:hypothetical protein